MQQTFPNDVSSSANRTSLVAYETRLTRESRWALAEGSKFFEGKSAVQDTLLKITTRLRELSINYAVVGGMALFVHGFRRFTEDVDLLVTHEGLQEIHRQLEGLGYLPHFRGSKNLRDTETGVKIEFLVSGEFPGDGKPKPIAFPDPAAVAMERDGISYVNLPTLFDMKIASGMSTTQRLKDLADAQELMKILDLPLEFVEQLHPFVRDKFRELWHAARPRQVRYVRFWHNHLAAGGAKNLAELMAIFQQAAIDLQAMLVDGVTLDFDKGSMDKGFCLVTTDPEVAKKHDMHDETELLAS